MIKWFKQPVYPYLLALAAVLIFLNQSPLNSEIGPVLFALCIALALTLAVTSIFHLLFRDAPKAAFISFLILGPFFSYTHLTAALSLTPYYSKIYHYHIPAIIIGVIFVVGTWFTVRAKNFSLNVTKLATAFTLILVTTSTFATVNALQTASKVQASLTIPDLTVGDTRPDIYYLVFDEYTGPKALKDLYGYDDSPLLNGLRDKGFYVADNSTANYYGSLHSLSGTFNMRPLDDLTAKVTSKTTDEKVLQDLAENNRLVLSLKQAGYSYYHLGSWYEPTASNQNANANYYATSFLGLPNFTAHFLTDSTMLQPFFTNVFSYANNHQIIQFQQDKTVEIASEEDNPKFVFTHFILPHEPATYGPDCSTLSAAETAASVKNVPDYLNQVTCTNSIILSLVDKILAASKTPPIIIVQSDEGQGLTFDQPTSKDSPLGSMEERYSILNAFYFPDKDYSALYPTMTSVNTFRIVLNQYLGANLPLKPDKNYILDDYYAINQSIDITDEVKESISK